VRRTYLPRIVGDNVMMPADLKRLHKYMVDVEHIGIISDEMREVVEELWPELAHKNLWARPGRWRGCGLPRRGGGHEKPRVRRRDAGDWS
jgi:hypothetical protein